jgi:hypothetical protein
MSNNNTFSSDVEEFSQLPMLKAINHQAGKNILQTEKKKIHG